jgi:hypothetical protein
MAWTPDGGLVTERFPPTPPLTWLLAGWIPGSQLDWREALSNQTIASNQRAGIRQLGTAAEQSLLCIGVAGAMVTLPDKT